ncbi:MAG: DUF5312 family protein [Spirochaetaceae bacterium]
MEKFLDFIDTLIAYILYGNEDKLIKHKSLRNMRKELSSENSKFIGRQGKKVTSLFAAKVLQLYRNIDVLREIIPLDQKEREEILSDERMRDFLILRRLPEEGRGEHLDFSYEVLSEEVNTSNEDTEELWKKWNNNFSKFKENFKRENFFGFNEGLAQLERFSSLMEFDFTSFLAHFDPSFSGDTPAVSPGFSDVSANQVLQDLLDLYYIVGGLEISAALRTNLEYLLEFFNRYSETNARILRESVDQIEILLENSLGEQVLRTMICLIEFEPYEEPKRMALKRDYLTEFLEKREERFMHNKELLQRDLLDKKLKLHIDTVFEGEPLEETTPYDEENEKAFVEMGFPCFFQRKPLRLLKSYYTRRFNKGFYGSLKKVAAEGYFENRQFKESFTDTLFKVEGELAEIEQFLHSLSGKGSMSMEDALKILRKETISETEAVTLKRFVKDVNARARKVVEASAKNLNNLLYAVGRIVGDYRSKNPRFVSNLRVIAGERSAEVMRKIEDGNSVLTTFVEVLRSYTVVKENEEDKSSV